MGGMQRVSMQLVDQLQKMDGVNIMPITLHAKWKHIGMKTAGFLMKLARQLPSIAKDFNADAILFSSMVTASLAPLLKKRLTIPMITINHGQDVTMPVRVYQSYVPKVFKALDGVISVSQATRDQCIARGLDPKKGVALPNGFPEEWRGHMIERQQANVFLKKEFGIPTENKILLTVGRMVKRKGHQWFANQVLPKLPANYTWLVIGDGPEFEQLKESVVPYLQSKKVILAGRQPDRVLYNAYSGSDVFIMPNIPIPGDMEGFGVVMLEAGLAGTPSIAADLEGIRDVIQNGTNGYRIPSGSVEKFVETIHLVLDGEVESLRKTTNEFVTNNFSWEHVAQRYVAFIQQIIQQKKETQLALKP
jgi:phosphatidylinositol alpha-1,6-mannosyltransferase